MIIAVPARSGSKRVPYKNIFPLNGKPLLAYTLDAILASSLNEQTYLSTDDESIARIARDYPQVKVVMRPPELANDTASTESVLLHLLDVIAKEVCRPKWLMTLPPTSPFRTAATIRLFADAAANAESDIDCFMSVTERREDFWQVKDDGRMRRLFPGASRRQQDRPPLFEENSAVYVSRVTSLIETGSILGRVVSGIPISKLEGFDINTREDIQLAECLGNRLYEANR